MVVAMKRKRIEVRIRPRRQDGLVPGRREGINTDDLGLWIHLLGFGKGYLQQLLISLGISILKEPEASCIEPGFIPYFPTIDDSGIATRHRLYVFAPGFNFPRCSINAPVAIFSHPGGPGRATVQHAQNTHAVFSRCGYRLILPGPFPGLDLQSPPFCGPRGIVRSAPFVPQLCGNRELRFAKTHVYPKWRVCERSWNRSWDTREQRFGRR